MVGGPSWFNVRPIRDLSAGTQHITAKLASEAPTTGEVELTSELELTVDGRHPTRQTASGFQQNSSWSSSTIWALRRLEKGNRSRRYRLHAQASRWSSRNIAPEKRIVRNNMLITKAYRIQYICEETSTKPSRTSFALKWWGFFPRLFAKLIL